MHDELRALRDSRDEKLSENERKQIELRKERELIYSEFTEARDKIIKANLRVL